MRLTCVSAIAAKKCEVFTPPELVTSTLVNEAVGLDGRAEDHK